MNRWKRAWAFLMAHPVVGFALALTIAVVAFYGVGIALGRQLFFTNETAVGNFSPGSDLWHLNYPFQHFLVEELRHWRLPFWCPELGTGQPLLAEGEVAALYPVNLLLHLLPLTLALNWSVLLHFVIAGVLTALLAQELGASRAGGLLAGVVFAFSGFLVTHLKHTSLVETSAWVPALFLALERLRRGQGARAPIVLAVVVALLWYAGHPQITYYALMFGALYALYLGVAALVARGQAPQDKWPAVLRFGGRALLAVVLGTALALPQVLPTMELNRVGPRAQGTDYHYATWNDYPLSYLELMIRPMALGDPGELREATGPLHPEMFTRPELVAKERLVGFQPTGRPNLFWEVTGYVGILALLLAAVGLVAGVRKRRGVGMGLLLVLATVLVLGEHAGLIRVFCLLPGFTSFRHHTRMLLFVDLPLAVLAGLGATALVGWIRQRWRAIGVVAAVAMPIVSLLDVYIALGDHNPKIDPSRWLEPPEMVRRIEAAQAGQHNLYRVAVLDTAGFVFANAYRLARGWKHDLAPYDRARDMIYPDSNLLYGVSLLNQRIALYPVWTQVDEASPRLKMGPMSLYNVRYAIEPFNQDIRLPTPSVGVDRKWNLVATLPGDQIQGFDERYEIRLYENPDVLPRAFLVPHARVSSSALWDIGKPGFDPRREVLLSVDAPGSEPSWLGTQTEPIAAPVNVVDYEPQRVRLELDAPERCWLFVSDTYYAEWEARLDGRQVPIYRANQAGRAVEVPAGAHGVEFRYRPRAFERGLAAAFAALLGLAGWGYLERRARTPRHPPTKPAGD